jgi:arylsulfatase A-like enzyme/Tfp pilus assembly protein PilF
VSYGVLGLSILVGCRPTPPAHPNVLLVTLDTTRADHIGSYGYGLAHTPTLDGLAREGVRVADAATAAPITLPSHSTILTGLYPAAHGVRDNGSYALGNDATTLAERLRAAGYATHAVVSALVLNRRYNLTQGFDAYDDDLWAEDDPKLFMIRMRPGAKTAEHVDAWLDEWRSQEQRKPFFVWAHFFDAHQPYRRHPGDWPLAPTMYDREIAYEDGAVGTILDHLRELHELDRTLVVVTADHGESLGEHGEPTHAIFIYDATVHVPLLLRLPGLLPAGRVYEGPARTVDIVPTILAALRLPGGEETQGRNLLPALRGDEPAPDLPQYCESLLSEVGFGMAPLQGLRAGGYKWIRAPKPELYDLHADPHELHNLVAEQPRRAAALDGQLQAVLVDSERRRLAPQKSPMDRETEDMLRALGYLGASGMRQAVGGMDPKDGMALYNLLDDARHFAQAKRWPEAEQKLRDVLAALPGNVSAVNILGLVHTRQGRFAEARQDYLHSLALDPKQARVYGVLGTLSLIEGKVDEAEREYRQGLAIWPDFVEAMSNLGMIEALRSNPAGATAWYQKAIAADPGYPRVYRRIADVFYDQQDWQRALHYYRKTLAGRHDDFEALIQAGNCARRLDKPGVAQRYFRNAGRLRPDAWIPPFNSACLAARNGNAERALRFLSDSVQRGLPGALLDSDPDLASLHGSARFTELASEAKARRPADARGAEADPDWTDRD